MGLKRPDFGMAAKYDFIVGGFGADEKQAGMKGSRDEAPANGIVDHYLIPRARTAGTSYSPPESPIIKIGKPPPDEDEDEDCEAELAVSGFRGPEYLCPSAIEDGNARMNVGTVAMCACEESGWSLGGFDLVASGTGHDAADISLVEVLGPANAFGTYPADDGVFSAIFYNPVTIAKGECVSFNVFYTFSFDPEEYAYDELKSFKWQTGGVSAFPLDCDEGEIFGKARMDSLTFARVFTYREGLLTNVYAKIQEAIDNQGTIDEDELRVCPGTYEEAVEINKMLRISSFDGRDKTTIKGLNRQENIIAARKGFSLKGFTITSFAHGVNNGIFMGELGFGNFGPDWNTNTEIEDNRFVNLDNGITVESIFHISPGNIFINNNIFSNIEEVAISLPGFRNTHISGNDFAGTSGRCTSIRAAVIDTAEIKNNTNMLSTSIDYMLSVETGSYLLFEGNHSSPNVSTLNSIYGIGKESATSHSRSVVVRNNQLFSLFMIRVPGAIVENNTIEEKFSFHYGKHIVFRENHVNEVYLLEVRSDGWNRSQISNNQMDNHRGLWIDDCEWIDIVDNSLTNSVYNGMYLTGSQNINVLKNYIAKNTLWPGILLVNSNRIIIRQNRVHENRTGIDARSLSSSAIINNSLLNNCTAFRNVYWGAAVSRNIELSNNVVRSSFCLFTGVDLSGAEGAVVSGNSIVDNFGAGFRLNNNANALFSNNNIFGNTHQVINNNPDTLLVANGNFWGTSDGPQPGDVEGMVDIDSWREEPVNLNIAFLERDVYARHGETDSLLVFIQNLTDANDEIAVIFNDTKGWLESESPIFTQFTDSTGFVFDLVFHIPEGELDSTLVTVTTTSALRNEWEAHGEVVIFSYDPHPALVVVEPDSVAMLQSDSLFVAARVYDQLDRRLDVPVTWSATAGEVDAPGVFRPGEHTGVLTITATATPPGGKEGEIPVQPVSGHATIRVYDDALPLAHIILTPDTTYLTPGQSGFFSYAALCPEGFGLLMPESNIMWTATGGEINTFGHYVAGEQTGTFEVTLTDIVSEVSGTAVVIIADPPQLPAPPQLLSPADASEGLAMPVAISWTESEDTDFYILEVGPDEQLDDPVLFLGLQDISYTYHQLEPHTTYYWRVFASGEAGVSSPSAIWSFATGEGEAPEVPETFHVSGAVAAGADECFNALQTIFTGGGQGNFVVESGGSATLIAGQNIIMQPGTHIEQGAWMHAYIAPDGPFCGDQEKHFLEAELLAEDDTGKPDANRDEMGNDSTDKDGTDKDGNDMGDTKAPSEPITTGPPDSTQKAFTSKLFSVYPNPTRDLFTIELQQYTGAELMRVEVYNMHGERIITEELPAGARHALSLEEQQAGVYLVRVVVGDRMGIERVVKW
jgi:parallel beta-helix repeat protein